MSLPIPNANNYNASESSCIELRTISEIPEHFNQAKKGRDSRKYLVLSTYLTRDALPFERVAIIINTFYFSLHFLLMSGSKS